MSGTAPASGGPTSSAANAARRLVESVGRVGYETLDRARGTVAFVGGLADLLRQTIGWIYRAVLAPDARLGRSNLIVQMVRVGVRSIPIIVLVQTFVGIILALQLAPTLESYGQTQRVADVVGIAMFRELGPLLSAIVLSGFAGASIAAEIGTMVEGEEIKALRAAALNPVRFLVVPRFLATVVMLTALTVIADTVGVLGGLITSVGVLNIGAREYLTFSQQAIKHQDFLTGLLKAAVFGVLISMIACREGLTVSGGAEGVGRATTNTVIKSIVALITTDVVFTSLFYAYGF
ncbi:MAG: ABC transporter permease [Phycisphaerae bacterium]|nr:ABC transporter permease [Phycisphaerae bacterium]